MSALAVRGRYQGLFQILQFNWRFYLGTVAGVCAAMYVAPLLPAGGRLVLILGIAVAAFWLASSLLVSHYIYDRFPLYDLKWVARLLPRAPHRWINIHCGLDETSDLLAAVFPEAVGQVIDIFDARLMTERSIVEARRLRPSALPFTCARHDALDFHDGAFDTAFLIFAAHELRRHDDRVTLFREVARILTPCGSLIVVEHSRDVWNFLAFGPGFLHFFSPGSWRKAALEAGLRLRGESSLTPFVRVYELGSAR